MDPWVGKIPWRRAGNPLLYSCLDNPHGQRSLEGYSPWGRKEFDMTEQLSTAQHVKENMGATWSNVPTEYKIFSK